MKQLSFHEVADIFPEMNQEQFDALVADIDARGQLQPIFIHNGQIIDGKHRYRACQQLGIEPVYADYDDSEVSVLQFVISQNLMRRHLTPSQKAAVAAEAEDLIEAERAKAAARRAAELKQNRDTVQAQMPERAEPPQQYRDVVAKQFDTSPRYVQDAIKLRTDNAEMHERVKAGELTLTAARRELKERAREERRQQNTEKIQQSTASGTVDDLQSAFSTIVIDPPWDWGDEGDVDQFGRARPTYQTMTFEQLRDELPVARLADDDCHIYLWITNRSLPKGFALLEAWGFRYVTCLTWCKPSIGMGNYFRGSTEHVLFGVKGSQSLKRKDVGTWFQAKRGKEHSSKPEEFVQLVESCSPGPYLDMFGRSSRDGWVCWGEDGVS